MPPTIAEKCRKVAESCRIVPNIRHNSAQFGNTFGKFGVCYLLIQLAILWQSRNPGSHANLFGCPITGWSPELLPENDQETPNCAEVCQIFGNIAGKLPNLILPNCAEYLPKSIIVQNTILGVHLHANTYTG